jgi:lysophospholipid acyltransferase (LPLAT)-like uncharacterized protein
MNAPIQIAERGRPLGSPFSVWLHFRAVPLLGALLLKLLAYTLRVTFEGREAVDDLIAADKRFILSFWHRRLAMMPLAYPFRRPGRGVAILSSDSKDGERSAATWRHFGIHAVRGTASDDGAKALVRMIQIVKQGWDLGITPDGPRGPRQILKPGVISVARKTGAHIVPVCVAFDRAWKLKTWDELLIPKPFARCTVRFGEPRSLPREGKDDEEHATNLEQQLNQLEHWAEQIHD